MYVTDVDHPQRYLGTQQGFGCHGGRYKNDSLLRYDSVQFTYRYQHFGRSFSLYLQRRRVAHSTTLKKEAEGSFETLVRTYRITRCHIPKDCILQVLM
jgi:hypothetical protein